MFVHNANVHNEFKLMYYDAVIPSSSFAQPMMVVFEGISPTNLLVKS
jgi:hypothetical protein